jgi:hypothetical protein
MKAELVINNGADFDIYSCKNLGLKWPRKWGEVLMLSKHIQIWTKLKETSSFWSLCSKSRVRVKQRTYFPLVSATEMDIWQAILT